MSQQKIRFQYLKSNNFHSYCYWKNVTGYQFVTYSQKELS